MADLLKTRYEVIADYPGSEYPVGLVLVEDLPGHFSYQKDGRNWTTRLKDINYPHLFRKMNWWENRTAEEMPKKVKLLADKKGRVFEIEEWDIELLIGWIDKSERSCCSLLGGKPGFGYVPVL